uniref:BZIP domain-containing protein n=1 Tax=Glossina morsitans morsitans TaxID=37546 RepID=A0A1B0G287_GLOMM
MTLDNYNLFNDEYLNLPFNMPLSPLPKVLVSMECMQTGVPTLTTPTLTPTTLRNIEESFIQLTSEPINAPYQAGFIPPPLGSYNASSSSNNNNNSNSNNNNNNNNTTTSANVLTTNATLNNVYLGDLSGGTSLHDYGNINDSETENSQGSWNPGQLNEDNSLATTDTSSAATDSTSFQHGLNSLGINTLNNSNSVATSNDFATANIAAMAAVAAAAKIPNTSNTSNSATTATTANAANSNAPPPTRRGGGRRPTNATNMTPEEEEKRRIRRERNKLAAARCRKRRVDQTNELTEEVTQLEKKREDLQKQIESLNGTKQELEFILEAHLPTCQKLRQNLLNVNAYGGLSNNDNITGLDTTLASTARSISPIDLKPVLSDQLLTQIKPEPLDSALDSNSSLDQDGPPSPKRLLLSNHNPMIPPPLPNVATLSASLAAASASLNTPIVTTAPVSFGSMFTGNSILNTSNIKTSSKQRPNSLPTVPRNMAQNLALNVDGTKPPTDINGVAIQTPSTGMFNFDSLMDGGTGLTPVSGPLIPNCSSQNKHPLELVTPTSEPSKILSL